MRLARPFRSQGPPRISLPPAAPGATPPTDLLFYCGRTLTLASTAALSAPATDPLALIRPTGTLNPFVIAATVVTPGSVTVAPANYDALACTNTGSSVVTLNSAMLVAVAPALAAAGFYPASPLPVPATNLDRTWAIFNNITA